ncbi:hypothetical protein [Bacillus sp. AK031]
MNSDIRALFENLASKEKTEQYEAYQKIMELTEKEVDWSYDVWDRLIEDLSNKDPHKRSRAAQFLSHLAISDPENKILQDFPMVWEITKDEKFVTARHALQAIWRVGLAGKRQKELVVSHLIDRFHHCTDEKNSTLIRFDIIQDLRNLFDILRDESLKGLALELIESEEDSKYKKKYASVWKNA